MENGASHPLAFRRFPLRCRLSCSRYTDSPQSRQIRSAILDLRGFLARQRRWKIRTGHTPVRLMIARTQSLPLTSPRFTTQILSINKALTGPGRLLRSSAALVFTYRTSKTFRHGLVSRSRILSSSYRRAESIPPQRYRSETRRRRIRSRQRWMSRVRAASHREQRLISLLAQAQQLAETAR